MQPVHRVVSRLTIGLFLWLQTTLGVAGIWQEAEVAAKPADSGSVYYRALRADHAALKQVLAAAPLEYTSSQGAGIALPMPDGSMQRFEVENSPIMEPELAARYPEIQTYRVRGLDDASITGRLDLTRKGFHAMLSGSDVTVYIDPDGSGGYRSYYRKDLVLAGKGVSAARPHCLVESTDEALPAARPSATVAQRISGSRRVYRLALAATGEYTQFHGGTVAAALAEMVTAINRVNQLYGRDLAVQLVLVSNNDRVIYTDPANDPYTNDDGTAMLSENQTNLDAVIGSQNYDIGHVFSTGGGGIAGVGVACRSDYKAQGVTGLSNPVGDLFYIDFVAHEIGHQLDAQHTFNGTTDACGTTSARIADSAVEPGSGSSIMAYAGICGNENLQSSADAAFHSLSIQQILNYSFSPSGAGSNCGTLNSTGNTAPTVNAGSDHVIPVGTPFRLTGSATDPDGDTLSYQWDQMDANGTATTVATFDDDLGDNPLFRSFMPKDGSQRVLPRLSSLLAGDLNPLGETLPTTNRSLKFRLTVRDGESGVAEDDVTLTVDITQGPFLITGGSLNSLGQYAGGSSSETINWSVSNTGATCPQVAISLYSFSADGSTYCDVSDDSALDLGVHTNNGSATVTLPDKAISRARVEVACHDNIFRALSAADIEITSASGATVADDCQGIDGTVVAHGVVFNDPDEGTTIIEDSGGGGGGALFLLPALLGFRLAGRRNYKLRQPAA